MSLNSGRSLKYCSKKEPGLVFDLFSSKEAVDINGNPDSCLDNNYNKVIVKKQLYNP